MARYTILKPATKTVTVVYRHTGKRIGNSFEYQSISKTKAPYSQYFSLRQLREMILPDCPLMVYPDAVIPEYVASVMYSTTA